MCQTRISYGPVLGLPELRHEVATQWSAAYQGEIRDTQVAITSGCNQAFAAAITAICSEADEVILPTPWYFNHKMWLDMLGIKSVPLATDGALLPDPEQAKALITEKTRAIALGDAKQSRRCGIPARTGPRLL